MTDELMMWERQWRTKEQLRELYGEKTMSDERKPSPWPWRWDEYVLRDANGRRIIELSSASGLPPVDAILIADAPRTRARLERALIALLGFIADDGKNIDTVRACVEDLQRLAAEEAEAQGLAPVDEFMATGPAPGSVRVDARDVLALPTLRDQHGRMHELLGRALPLLDEYARHDVTRVCQSCGATDTCETNCPIGVLVLEAEVLLAEIGGGR